MYGVEDLSVAKFEHYEEKQVQGEIVAGHECRQLGPEKYVGTIVQCNYVDLQEKDGRNSITDREGNVKITDDHGEGKDINSRC